MAAYIGDRFQTLAEFASNAYSRAQIDTVRKQVTSFKEALCKEREQLIGQEIALYAIV